MLYFEDFCSEEKLIAVVGLGYVGLPLAVGLARHFNVLGFDISQERVNELQDGYDKTGEIDKQVLFSSSLTFSSNSSELSLAKIIIIAVPTPVDTHRTPDLTPLIKATKIVGSYLTHDTIVVYESTVYPGVTEDVCVPILEQMSGLKYKESFHVGYSPERINPGDKVHTVDKIIKIVSASSDSTRELLSNIYGKVTTGGVYKASSIKVAEAAKVIENTQRDLNIALMNELSVIFDKLGIDTLDVLEAAGTKWNFLPFRPGLVGGHCISVDPYYLTHKAEAHGYHPEVILAGRRINDSMGKFIAEKTVKMLISSGINVNGARVGIFGLTFKENVPDLRNTRVIDIYRELKEYGLVVEVHDPHISEEEALHEYGLRLIEESSMKNFDSIIISVAHDIYRNMPLQSLLKRFTNPDKAVLLDIKGIFNKEEVKQAGVTYWRL